MSPIRVQRSRAKGWRMPENTVYVGRPSRWGNPFEVGQPSGVFNDGKPVLIESLTLEQCLRLYRDLTHGFLVPEMYPYGHSFMRNWREKWGPRAEFRWAIKFFLSGQNLACWCPLDQPCHADLLLKIANHGE